MVEPQPEPERTGPTRVEAVPACPICGGPGTPYRRDLSDRLWGAPGRWSFHRCNTDGNLWLNPRPVDADLGLCYPAGYFTHSASATPRKPRRQSERQSFKETLRRRILAAAYGYTHLRDDGHATDSLGELLARVPVLRWEATHHLGAFMPPYQKDGRLLDVGCGNGQYLARMQSYGWEVAGIEVDAQAAEVARRERGLTVHAGPVESAPFPPASFDVVACQHVIEHVTDPRGFLTAVGAYLRPGGRLLIVTPNAQSLGHRLFREDCYSLDPPRHLVLYSLRGFRQLLRQIPSLELVRLRTHTRNARKIFRQWRSVRRSGCFRGAGVKVTAADRLGAALFSYVEALGAGPLAWGEEIELVARRR
jgi:2-polyprenyl-3-methyl-5-hydroxy-6-metoxy-1,4-benzoquinol methylase